MDCDSASDRRIVLDGDRECVVRRQLSEDPRSHRASLEWS